MHLLDPLFQSEAMRAVFSDHRQLQSMLDFESALARVEGRLRIIPSEAAAAIARNCRAELFSAASLAGEASLQGNLAIPMVKHLTALVRKENPASAGYVHWGTTSQDAIDTGLVLQLRDAIELLDAGLRNLCQAVADLTRIYRYTALPGRTWLQSAVPVTFGLKTAGWLDALLRHRNRLQELRPRLLVLQFGGAAGTLASLRDRGLEVSAGLAQELNLALPAIPWHAHRDRLAEAATFLGLLTGTLGKIARDLALQTQTGIGEISVPDAGGSSTMPQKQNPVACAVVLSAAITVPGLAGTMLSAMVQEHERGLGGWHAEWETLPQIWMISAGALERMIETMKGLLVHADAMRANLQGTNGLVMAEAVSMALAEKIGRDSAHALLQSASRQSMEEGRDLRAVLEANPEVTRHIPPEQMNSLFDPLQYLGIAQQFIDGVLAAHRAAGEGRT